MVSDNHPVMSDEPEVIDMDTNDEAHENVRTALNGDLAAVDRTGSSEVVKLAADMQQRCRLFLDELEQFQAYLKDQKKENQVELRTFKAGLQSEMRTIEKVSIDCHSLGHTIC